VSASVAVFNLFDTFPFVVSTDASLRLLQKYLRIAPTLNIIKPVFIC